MIAIRPLSPTRAIRVVRTSVPHALLDDDDTAARQRGRVIHALCFGEAPKTVNIPFDSYRTKEAKRLRDEAEAQGFIPLKIGEEDKLTVAVEKLSPRLMKLGYTRFEVPFTWEVDGCPHRGRLDQLDEAGLVIGDLKTCEGGFAIRNASDSSIYSSGYHIQAAAYVEAVAWTYGVSPDSFRYRLHFAEIEPPFGIVTVNLAPSMLRLGAAQWERARQKWLAAYRSGNFEPYAGEDERTAEAPAYALAEEEEKAMDERGEAPF